MEDYHDEGMENLAEEDFVFFLVATQGEGDPTDNAIGFYNWIKSKEREEDELGKVTLPDESILAATARKIGVIREK